MVSRITVSLPDDLHDKLKEYGVNPSKLFQSAAAKKVEDVEKWNSRLPKDESKDEMVERLRQQKAESESDDYEQGRTEGLEFAKNSDYSGLRAAINLINDVRDFYAENSYIPQVMLFEDEYLGNYFNEYEHCGYKTTIDPAGRLTDASVKWFEGWSDGVESLWDSLPDDLKS